MIRFTAVIDFLVHNWVKIPNAFTPNGDGVNDQWLIEGIHLFPDAKINVFNRWGQIIYSSRGNGEPWDGTLNNNQLPSGTYFYTIELDSNNEPYTGLVTIVR